MREQGGGGGVLPSSVSVLGSRSTAKSGRGREGSVGVGCGGCVELSACPAACTEAGAAEQGLCVCRCRPGLVVMVPLVPEPGRQWCRRPELLRAAELACS